ncbi:MAG TPA: DNA-binding protein [Candidatus Norongarragalinales archaeon]|nr:DNA-binding protein [Candidatus Norongarragalinales archaeon]
MEPQDQQKEIEEIRKRQLQELQLREILKKILDAGAFERLSNIRMANRTLYAQLVQMLVYAYQQGQLNEKMSEKQLLDILHRLKAGERQTSITFKRK